MPKSQELLLDSGMPVIAPSHSTCIFSEYLNEFCRTLAPPHLNKNTSWFIIVDRFIESVMLILCMHTIDVEEIAFFVHPVLVSYR